MPRLARNLRRPAVLLAGLYLAGVGVFAAVLRYRPAAVVPRGDFNQLLIGFSSDGCRLATGPQVLHLFTIDGVRGVNLPDDPFQVWDVTRPACDAADSAARHRESGAGFVRHQPHQPAVRLALS